MAQRLSETNRNKEDAAEEQIQSAVERVRAEARAERDQGKPADSAKSPGTDKGTGGTGAKTA
ncbi:MAG: hypothetical protein K8F25_02445, partial [Fimbriimonadaceae bacterium]|nr:hypothetical protein [Alphaproteobacteria bacterium]